MKLTEALSGVRRLFLDSAPVIYYVEANTRYLPVLEPVFALLDAGSLQSVTAPITLSECLIIPYRTQAENLRRLFTQLIAQQSLFVTLDQPLAHSAARLRSEYNLNLLDAFQIASALASRCEAFLTNDLALKRVSALRIVVLDEFERPETAP